MSFRRTALLLTALFAGGIACGGQAPGETIRQFLECTRRQRDLTRREAAATAVLKVNEKVAQSKQRESHGPFDPKRVERLRCDADWCEPRLARLHSLLPFISVRDPALRQAKQAEVEAKIVANEEARAAAMARSHAIRAKIRDEERALAKALEEAVDPVGRTPRRHGVTKTNHGSRVESGLVAVTWRHLEEERQVASLWLYLLTTRTPFEPVGRLAGKYPVREISDHTIRFEVGGLPCSFSIQKAEWQNVQELPHLLEEFIDLPALAHFSSSLSANGGLGQRVADCVKSDKNREVQWGKEMHPIESRLRTCRQELSALRKPYSRSRIAQWERDVARLEQRLSCDRVGLAEALVEDPGERSLAFAKATEELSRIQEEIQEIVLAYRPERVALKRPARYVEFAAWELVDGVAYTRPQIGIVETVVKPNLERGCIGVRWVDAYDRSIASGGLSFGPVPRKVTEKGDVVGTYPVKSWDDESIDFWVGGVNVRLRVWKKGWQDKEGTLALTTKLLNLDAIAAWPKITDTR